MSAENAMRTEERVREGGEEQHGHKEEEMSSEVGKSRSASKMFCSLIPVSTVKSA